MRRAILVLLTTALTSLPGLGQMSASASVPISLRVPGSITLSLQTVPVAVSVVDGTQHSFAGPLSITWNLDPREVPAFRVVARLQDGPAALADPATLTAVPATELVSRWGEGEFLPFTSDATATLFRTNILPDLRRGQKQDVLELKITDAAAASLADGSYQGVLYLEVRYY